jgi:hypothetical protein
MMKPEEKVAQYEFSIDTALSLEAIRKAGQRSRSREAVPK